MAFERLDERRLRERPEVAREGLLLLGGQVLVAQENDAVRGERAAAIVDAVIAANEKSVAEFRAGKDKAFNALVGQVMKASQGKANPAQAGELLRQRLQAT